MQVNFRYGSKEELDKHPITPGNFYVITDTQKIYFDSYDSKRIELGEMQALTKEELDKILV